MDAHPLFAFDPTDKSVDDRVRLAYARARAVLQAYALTIDDIAHLSPKFWALHLDPVLPLDVGMFTILAAHVNLALGTLAAVLPRRPDLRPLVESMLRLDTVGVYLLSERGHGLDAFNIETTATMTPDGFVLHTPREQAAKFMPATTPAFGIPKVALVMARLLVDGTDRGSRFFLVPICSSTQMCAGVASTRLPRRAGTAPLDFSLTTFTHVRLPRTALLSADLAAPAAPRAAWWAEVHRIPLGSMLVAAPCIQGLKHAAYIAGTYARTRRVDAGRTPILAFPATQWAVLHAAAAGTVLDAWYRAAAAHARPAHALAVVVKATACRAAIEGIDACAERCGAQGTFAANFMPRFAADARGIVIAEGDVHTLCTRLLAELRTARTALPLPARASSPLAARAHAVLAADKDAHGHMHTDARTHRHTDGHLRAEHVVTALGHALAYDAARAARVHPALLALYEAGVARADPVWFAVGLQDAGAHDARAHAALQDAREHAALRAALPLLPRFLAELGVERCVRAMMLEGRWEETLGRLPRYVGAARAGDAQAAVGAKL